MQFFFSKLLSSISSIFSSFANVILFFIFIFYIFPAKDCASLYLPSAIKPSSIYTKMLLGFFHGVMYSVIKSNAPFDFSFSTGAWTCVFVFLLNGGFGLIACRMTVEEKFVCVVVDDTTDNGGNLGDVVGWKAST